MIARFACVGLIVFSGLAHAQDLPDKACVLSSNNEAIDIDIARLLAGDALETNRTGKKSDAAIAKVQSPLRRQRRNAGGINSSSFQRRLASSELANLYRPIFLILGVAY